MRRLILSWLENHLRPNMLVFNLKAFCENLLVLDQRMLRHIECFHEVREVAQEKAPTS